MINRGSNKLINQYELSTITKIGNKCSNNTEYLKMIKQQIEYKIIILSIVIWN